MKTSSLFINMTIIMFLILHLLLSSSSSTIEKNFVLGQTVYPACSGVSSCSLDSLILSDCSWNDVTFCPGGRTGLGTFHLTNVVITDFFLFQGDSFIANTDWVWKDVKIASAVAATIKTFTPDGNYNVSVSFENVTNAAASNLITLSFIKPTTRAIEFNLNMTNCDFTPQSSMVVNIPSLEGSSIHINGSIWTGSMDIQGTDLALTIAGGSTIDTTSSGFLRYKTTAVPDIAGPNATQRMAFNCVNSTMSSYLTTFDTAAGYFRFTKCNFTGNPGAIFDPTMWWKTTVGPIRGRAVNTTTGLVEPLPSNYKPEYVEFIGDHSIFDNGILAINPWNAYHFHMIHSSFLHSIRINQPETNAVTKVGYDLLIESQFSNFSQSSSYPSSPAFQVYFETFSGALCASRFLDSNSQLIQKDMNITILVEDSTWMSTAGQDRVIAASQGDSLPCPLQGVINWYFIRSQIFPGVSLEGIRYNESNMTFVIDEPKATTPKVFFEYASAGSAPILSSLDFFPHNLGALGVSIQCYASPYYCDGAAIRDLTYFWKNSTNVGRTSTGVIPCGTRSCEMQYLDSNFSFSTVSQAALSIPPITTDVAKPTVTFRVVNGASIQSQLWFIGADRYPSMARQDQLNAFEIFAEAGSNITLSSFNVRTPITGPTSQISIDGAKWINSTVNLQKDMNSWPAVNQFTTFDIVGSNSHVVIGEVPSQSCQAMIYDNTSGFDNGFKFNFLFNQGTLIEGFYGCSALFYRTSSRGLKTAPGSGVSLTIQGPNTAVDTDIVSFIAQQHGDSFNTPDFNLIGTNEISFIDNARVHIWSNSTSQSGGFNPVISGMLPERSFILIRDSVFQWTGVGTGNNQTTRTFSTGAVPQYVNFTNSVVNFTSWEVPRIKFVDSEYGGPTASINIVGSTVTLSAQSTATCNANEDCLNVKFIELRSYSDGNNNIIANVTNAHFTVTRLETNFVNSQITLDGTSVSFSSYNRAFNRTNGGPLNAVTYTINAQKSNFTVNAASRSSLGSYNLGGISLFDAPSSWYPLSPTYIFADNIFNLNAFNLHSYPSLLRSEHTQGDYTEYGFVDMTRNTFHVLANFSESVSLFFIKHKFAKFDHFKFNSTKIEMVHDARNGTTPATFSQQNFLLNFDVGGRSHVKLGPGLIVQDDPVNATLVITDSRLIQVTVGDVSEITIRGLRVTGHSGEHKFLSLTSNPRSNITLRDIYYNWTAYAGSDASILTGEPSGTTIVIDNNTFALNAPTIPGVNTLGVQGSSTFFNNTYTITNSLFDVIADSTGKPFQFFLIVEFALDPGYSFTSINLGPGTVIRMNARGTPSFAQAFLVAVPTSACASNLTPLQNPTQQGFMINVDGIDFSLICNNVATGNPFAPQPPAVNFFAALDAPIAYSNSTTVLNSPCLGLVVKNSVIALNAPGYSPPPVSLFFAFRMGLGLTKFTQNKIIMPQASSIFYVAGGQNYFFTDNIVEYTVSLNPVLKDPVSIGLLCNNTILEPTANGNQCPTNTMIVRNNFSNVAPPPSYFQAVDAMNASLPLLVPGSYLNFSCNYVNTANAFYEPLAFLTSPSAILINTICTPPTATRTRTRTMLDTTTSSTTTVTLPSTVTSTATAFNTTSTTQVPSTTTASTIMMTTTTTATTTTITATTTTTIAPNNTVITLAPGLVEAKAVKEDSTIAVTSVSAASSALAMPSPSLITLASRVGLIASVASCESDLDEPLPFYVNPTGLELTAGKPEVRFHIGALVGNIAIVLGVGVVSLLYAVLHSAVLKTDEDRTFMGVAYRSLAAARFCGAVIFPLLFLLEPIVGSALTSLVHGNVNDAVVAVVVLVVTCVICGVFAMILLDRQNFTATYRTHEEMDIEKKIAERDRTAKGLPADDSDDERGVLGRCDKWYERKIEGVWGEWFQVSRSDEQQPYEARAKVPAAALEETEEQQRDHKYFFLRYGAAFDYYDGEHRWFLIAEMLASVLLGVCDGLVESIGCSNVAIMMCAVFGLYVVAVFIIRPYSTRKDFVFGGIIMLLNFISAILTVLPEGTLADDDRDRNIVIASTIALFVGLIASAEGLIINSLRFIGERLASEKKRKAKHQEALRNNNINNSNKNGSLIVPTEIKSENATTANNKNNIHGNDVPMIQINNNNNNNMNGNNNPQDASPSRGSLKVSENSAATGQAIAQEQATQQKYSKYNEDDLDEL